jgi:hypothetical protein
MPSEFCFVMNVASLKVRIHLDVVPLPHRIREVHCWNIIQNLSWKPQSWANLGIISQHRPWYLRAPAFLLSDSQSSFISFEDTGEIFQHICFYAFFPSGRTNSFNIQLFCLGCWICLAFLGVLLTQANTLWCRRVEIHSCNSGNQVHCWNTFLQEWKQLLERIFATMGNRGHCWLTTMTSNHIASMTLGAIVSFVVFSNKNSFEPWLSTKQPADVNVRDVA